MKYKTFKTEDEKGINEFLAEFGDKLGQGSVIKGTETVGFMYDERSDDEYRKNFRINVLKAKLLEEEGKKDDADFMEQLYIMTAKNEETEPSQKAINVAVDQRRYAINHIEAYKQVLKVLEAEK